MPLENISSYKNCPEYAKYPGDTGVNSALKRISIKLPIDVLSAACELSRLMLVEIIISMDLMKYRNR